MTLLRGISVLDLIDDLPAQARGFIPADVASYLELLQIVSQDSMTSGAFYVHHGLVQSATEAGLSLPRGFPLEIPGLNKGVAFQLSYTRTAATGGQNLEPLPAGWQLDLILDRLAVPIPGLKPAERIPSAPSQPAHLVPDPSRTRVKLYGKGVLRISSGAAGTDVRLIADPDPFAPTDPIGAVIELGMVPPHVLFMDNGFGMTVGTVTVDASDSFTPPEIVARGHGPDWRGFGVSEAAVYLPRDLPAIGDFSLGVRDMLIGTSDPGGVQLESWLEFGEAPTATNALQFFQDLNGQVTAVPFTTGPAANRTVTLHAQTGPTALVRARLNPLGNARWRRPTDRAWDTGGDTGWFTVRMDNNADVLKFRDIGQNAQGQSLDGQEILFRFERGAGAPTHAPFVRATLGANSWDNTAWVSGEPADLAGLSFTAIPNANGLPVDAETLTWELSHAGSNLTGSGATFAPAMTWQEGEHTVTLTQTTPAQGGAPAVLRRRRLRVEVIESGRVLIGRKMDTQQIDPATGVPGPIAPTQVTANHRLRSFHDSDELNASGPVTALAAGVLSVPDDGLAEVALELKNLIPVQPTVRPIAHLRVYMDYDATTVIGLRQISPAEVTSGGAVDPWGPKPHYPPFVGGQEQLGNTADARGSYSDAALVSWVTGIRTSNPGVTFIVIGHCCDIGTETYNQGLGRRRATEGRARMIAAGVPAGEVFARGENVADVAPSGPLPADPTGFAAAGRTLAERTAVRWRIKHHHFVGGAKPSGWGSTRSIPERLESRGVDIYAVLPTAGTGGGDDDERESVLRRKALVPGADHSAAIELQPAESNLAYRFEVRAKWDSPTWVDSRDSIPVLVQLTFDWTNTPTPLPVLDSAATNNGLTNGDIQPVNPKTNAPDNYRVVARFTFDPRSGEAVFGIALDSPGDPNGLAKFSGSNDAVQIFATALAIGPALMGGVTSADAETNAVRLSALLAAVLAASVFDVVKDGKVILHRVEIEHLQRDLGNFGGSRTRVLFDYSVELMCEAPAFGVKTEKPFKIKYKNVGLEFDDSKTGLEKFNIVYEQASFEIADAGKWTINGWLGKLLGVTAVRLGTGSVWFEIDLELALDLGVVEVSSATIRIKIDAGSVTVDLRGLAAKVDIPGTVKGAGALQVGDGGDVSASLDLTIIPAEIRAYAGLVMKDGMTHLEAGVRFATAIPLGGTGFGLFGFMGRFVSNGTRNLGGLSATDPIERELAWYALPIVGNPSKYRPEPGQYAIGLGAVVGTMPDAGFTFHAEGMLAIEFPDPSVVFTIDASLMSVAPSGASEEHDDSGTDYSLSLLGVIAIASSGLGIGIRGRFEIPRVLIAEIPISAWFPFQSGGTAGYLRVGSDGFGGRAGTPVSVTVLPGILDLKAWTFFMIEEKQMLDLGGKTDPIWDFYGFSIGMGAGFHFKWGGSAIYVEISASFLAGLGTRPFRLTAGVFVKGEIWLLIIGLGISAELVLSITEDDWVLKGEICAKISFFFFSIKGCVDFTIGNTPSLPPPPAEPLVTGVSLVDKFARQVGTAVKQGEPVGLANRAWPDTTLVVHFAHTVKLALRADSVQPGTSAWGSDWNGTSRLKYLYRLRSVRLLDAGGDPVTLDDAQGIARDASEWPSEWWMPAYRAALPEDGEPPAGEHEGWDLGVLKWDPAPWARNLPKGGADLVSDPAEVITRACDDAPRTKDHCVFGEWGRRLSPEEIELLGPGASALPYPSDFSLRGIEGLGPIGVVLLSQLGALFGLPFVPGAKTALPAPFAHPGHAPDLNKVWRLPYFVLGGRVPLSLGFRGAFTPEITRKANLTLALCLDLPRSQERRELCVNFQSLTPNRDLGNAITVDRVQFRDLGAFLETRDLMPFGSPDGVSELLYSTKGIEILLPEPAVQVVLTAGMTDVRQSGLSAIALDGEGNIVAEAQGSAAAGVAQVLTLSGPGIVRIVMGGGNGTGLLQSVCYTVESQVDGREWVKRVVSWMVESQKGRIIAPIVQGHRDDGEWVRWEPQLRTVEIGEEQACIFLRYAPKEPATWQGLQVLPFPFFRVGVVSACGISVLGWDAAQEAEQTREDLQDAVNTAVNGDQDDRAMLLDANASYTVEIEYDWAVWEYSEDHPRPPASSTYGWADGAGTTVHPAELQRFSFRTAPGGAISDTSLLTFDDQSRFEPRGLLRYLHGFDPEGTRPFHLLDDLLWVHFDVEWVQTLLERYGYELSLRVVRTDPAPPPPGGVLPDLRASLGPVQWQALPLHMQNLADIRLSQALIEAPCLDGPMPSGASAGIDAELEPRAEYDFIVEAVALSDPSAVKPIARSHFKTSRYRDARGLIDATGFTVTRRGATVLAGAEPNPLYPFDVVVSGAAPEAVTLGSDAALDEALAQMGMDPWPLPSQPGAVLIWREQGGSWLLEGILLDSDESLMRPARREDPDDPNALHPPERIKVDKARVGAHDFVPRRSNAAGTRILLAPAGGGVALAGGADSLVVALLVLDRSVVLQAERHITRLPHIVYQEQS